MPNNPDSIPGGTSLPLDQPQFQFATPAALAAFLNSSESTRGEIIQAIGYYTDPVTQTPAGNFYEYQPVEIGETGPAQLLDVVEVKGAWDALVAKLVDTFEFVDHAKVILGGKEVEVALLRKLQQPITQAGGTLTTTAPGWAWLTPKIDGNDLVVAGKCTWFGGPHDSQDSGETASARVNTRRQPDFRGCALPMTGFRRSLKTMGSPLPRFRWMTSVDVECVDAELSGRRISVPLIDLGPARDTKHAVDLTEPAFNALGVASSRGIINVKFRIRDWRLQLEPGATFTMIPASSSEQKPIDAAGNRICPAVSLPATFDTAGFTAFVTSLGLRFITPAELLPYFASVRNGVSNEPPDPALWTNFAPTLMVLDRVRAALGAPLHVTSSYRHPNYNAQLDGAATLSQHMAFRAADIQVAGMTPHDVHTALRAIRGTKIAIPAGAQFSAASMVNSGNGVDSSTPFNLAGLQIQDPASATAGSFLFEGGLGLYQTFVHVDCRGIRADW